MLAAAEDHFPEVITMRVKSGVDVNAKDPNGMTPLAYALTWGVITGQRPEVAMALMKSGANINEKDPNGGIPLMYAANNGNAPRLIPAFLKASADAKAKDCDGKTALDYAKANEKLSGTEAYRQLEVASRQSRCAGTAVLC